MSDADPRPGRARIRDATLLKLIAGVPQAGGRVWRGRAWPVSDANLPAVLVYIFRERKALLSEAGGEPMYRVTATLAVHCRVAAPEVPADTLDEAAHSGALLEDQMDSLAGAVERALLNDPEWVAQFERIPAVDTDMRVDPNADRAVGEAAITFTLEWTEDFPPDLPYALRTVALRAQSATGTPLAGADVEIPE